MLGFVMEAYDVKLFQISGPDWIGSTKFALTATVPKGATKAQYRLMLQNLLAERFKIKAHFEKREGIVFSLVMGKNGPKMQESAEEPAAREAAKAHKDAEGFPVYPEVRGSYTATTSR